jgi:hypothetical protein
VWVGGLYSECEAEGEAVSCMQSVRVEIAPVMRVCGPDLVACDVPACSDEGIPLLCLQGCQRNAMSLCLPGVFRAAC